MTSDELEAAIATFDSWAEARDAANAVMPRRKHNRPYPIRYGRASALAGRDQWIVHTAGNVVLLRDGTMYDFQRQVTVRP